MTDLPTKIRIGFRDFDVVRIDRMERDLFGECDVNRSVIRICTDFEPVRTANTLIHETLHAAWSSARLGDKEAEEKVVTHLADQLTQIWRDNPLLVEFINESLGHVVVA